MSDKPDETQRSPAPGEPARADAEPSAGPGGDQSRAEALDRTTVFDRPTSHFLLAERLCAHARRGPIFTDVSLTAELGQLVAVSGDGGDGRSSLLLALSGRFPTRSGTLTVQGQDRPAEIRRRFTVATAGTAIGFDRYHTVDDCIKETIAVSGKRASLHNLRAWFDRLAIAVDVGDTYGFLPRIDQVRFAVACAAATRVPAIVVDDVDTGLNGAGGEMVFETLRTVADAGQLVLVGCTRHDPPADTVVDLRGNHDENGGRP